MPIIPIILCLVTLYILSQTDFDVVKIQHNLATREEIELINITIV